MPHRTEVGPCRAPAAGQWEAKQLAKCVEVLIALVKGKPSLSQELLAFVGKFAHDSCEPVSLIQDTNMLYGQSTGCSKVLEKAPAQRSTKLLLQPAAPCCRRRSSCRPTCAGERSTPACFAAAVLAQGLQCHGPCMPPVSIQLELFYTCIPLGKMNSRIQVPQLVQNVCKALQIKLGALLCESLKGTSPYTKEPTILGCLWAGVDFENSHKRALAKAHIVPLAGELIRLFCEPL